MAAALTASQRSKVAQLMDLTDNILSEKQAIDILKAHKWSVDQASDYYYDNESVYKRAAAVGGGGGAARGGAGALSAASIDAEFDRLQDPAEPGKLNADQIVAFAGELGIDPFGDVTMLQICFHMGCKEQGVITKEEWRKGLTKLGASTVAELKGRVPALRADIKRDSTFAPFFSWVYDFSAEPGQKTPSLEVVQALIPILLKDRGWPLLDTWVEFLSKQKRTVPKDTWKMLVTFMGTIKPDCSNYDEDETSSWPVMLDEFVEYVRKTKGKAS